MSTKNGTKARKKKATEPKANGRPPIIATPEEFEYLADWFFACCEEDGAPLTITGLALFLGFADRQSLYDYHGRDGFSCIVKRSRLRVEHGYECRLGGSKPTGAIFALKNMGWADNRSVQLGGPDGEPLPAPSVVVYLPDHDRAVIPKAVRERMGVNGKPG